MRLQARCYPKIQKSQRWWQKGDSALPRFSDNGFLLAGVQISQRPVYRESVA